MPIFSRFCGGIPPPRVGMMLACVRVPSAPLFDARQRGAEVCLYC